MNFADAVQKFRLSGVLPATVTQLASSQLSRLASCCQLPRKSKRRERLNKFKKSQYRLRDTAATRHAFRHKKTAYISVSRCFNTLKLASPTGFEPVLLP